MKSVWIEDWCPPGWIPFDVIHHELFTRWEEWGVWPRFKRHEVEFAAYVCGEIFDPPAATLCEYLAPMLTTGMLRAAGIAKRDGRMIWLPSSGWRVVVEVAEPERHTFSATMAALAGLPLDIWLDRDFHEPFRPVIAAYHLAQACKASRLPKPPRYVPMEDGTTDLLELGAQAVGQLELPGSEPKQEVVHHAVAVPRSERQEATAIGRPPHTAMDRFIRKMIELAHEGRDGLPPKQDLQHIMEAWVGEEFSDGGPSETTIRQWLRRFDFRRDPPKARRSSARK